MNRYTTKMFLLLLGGAMSCQAGLAPLAALSMIESGNNDRAVGGAGEVSRYQIKPSVWRRYTNSRAYQDSALAAEVAQQHLASLDTIFTRRTGHAPTDFDRYVMWNAGPAYYERIGFEPRRVYPVVRRRAQRYVNLRETSDTAAMPEKSSVPVPLMASQQAR